MVTTAPKPTSAPEKAKPADAVHQRELPNSEVAANAARERGAAAPAYDRDESPRVLGFRMVPVNQPVHVDDEVVLHTPNPIDGKVENRATVTKVNPDRSINVKVELSDGRLHQMSGVKNVITEDRSPFWYWPEVKKPAKVAKSQDEDA